MQRTLFVALFGLCAVAALPLGLTDEQSKALASLQALDKGFIEEVKKCVGDLSLTYTQKISKITDLIKTLPADQQPTATELRDFAVKSETTIVDKLKDFVYPLLKEGSKARAVVDNLVKIITNHELTGQQIKDQSADLFNNLDKETKEELTAAKLELFGKFKGIAEQIAAAKQE